MQTCIFLQVSLTPSAGSIIFNFSFGANWDLVNHCPWFCGFPRVCLFEILQACRAVLRQQRWTCQSDLPDEWWKTVRANTRMLFDYDPLQTMDEQFFTIIAWGKETVEQVFFFVSLSLSLSLFIDSCHTKAVSGLVWPCLSLSCPGWDWNLFPHRIDSDCSSGTCYVGCSMKYHDIYLIGFPTGGLWHQGHWSWSWKYHRSFQKSWACTCACFAAWLEWGT